MLDTLNKIKELNVNEQITQDVNNLIINIERIKTEDVDWDYSKLTKIEMDRFKEVYESHLVTCWCIDEGITDDEIDCVKDAIQDLKSHNPEEYSQNLFCFIAYTADERDIYQCVDSFTELVDNAVISLINIKEYFDENIELKNLLELNDIRIESLEVLDAFQLFYEIM